jgi:sporulation protein YlmC with PRC-barrel domain
MKTLMMTSALVMAMTAPVFAQTATTTTTADATMTSPYLPGVDMGVRASDFIGKRIYVTETDISTMSKDAVAQANADWQDAGEISDVIMSMNGDTEAVLVDFGGFLGIGEKTVALNIKDLTMVPDSNSSDDYFIVFQGSKAELDSAPAFDPAMVFSTDTAAADGTAAVPADSTVTPAPADTAMAPADSTMAPADSTMAPADSTMAPADSTMAPADSTMAPADSTMAPADSTMAPADSTAAAPVDPAAPAADATAEATADTTDMSAGAAVDFSMMKEEDLIGKRVYGKADEDVGEISAVSMDASGKITGAIVDVGGFLGIGEKKVALGADQLTVMKEANGDGTYLHVNATEDELKAMAPASN